MCVSRVCFFRSLRASQEMDNLPVGETKNSGETFSLHLRKEKKEGKVEAWRWTVGMARRSQEGSTSPLPDCGLFTTALQLAQAASHCHLETNLHLPIRTVSRLPIKLLTQGTCFLSLYFSLSTTTTTKMKSASWTLVFNLCQWKCNGSSRHQLLSLSLSLSFSTSHWHLLTVVT